MDFISELDCINSVVSQPTSNMRHEMLDAKRLLPVQRITFASGAIRYFMVSATFSRHSIDKNGGSATITE